LPSAAEHRSERTLLMREEGGADTFRGPYAEGMGAVACVRAGDPSRGASRTLPLR